MINCISTINIFADRKHEVYSDVIVSIGKELDRHKTNFRSICMFLPFVGTILSTLFGTVSEGDVDDIRQAMSNLEQNQERTVHVIDETLTALNLTHEGVKENRRTINKLSSVVTELDTRFRGMHRRAEGELQNARLTLMVHDAYNLVSDVLIDTRLYLERLIGAIESASQGRLTTSLLSPQTLVELLRAIRRKLPPKDELPYSYTEMK